MTVPTTLTLRHHEGLLARSRKRHEELILQLLYQHGSLSRGELMAMSRMSRTTLYDIVVSLVDEGTVTVSVPEVARRKRGRPVERLALNPEAGRVIGIEFAQRAVRVATANVAHEVIGTASEQHDPGMPWKERVETAYRLVESVVGEPPRPNAVSAIGVGVGVAGAAVTPGTSDVAGAARSDPSGHGPVSALVRQRFGAAVQLDDSIRLAALAESLWGAASGASDVLYLQLSHSISGGLVVGGALHRGGYGAADGFGHITVDPTGAACGCGDVGCLETVASAGAVLAAYRAAGGVAEGLPDLVAALDAGDLTARAVLARAGTWIGRVLVTLFSTIDPRAIVIGGELADMGSAVLGPIARELNLGGMPGVRVQRSLRPARLGEMSAALGALALLRTGTAGTPLLGPPVGPGGIAVPDSALATPRPRPRALAPVSTHRGRARALS